MKIVVGTTSAIKLKAIENILQTYISETFSLIPQQIQSLVPDTPYDHETLQGAGNRARALSEKHTADLFVGLESGLIERYGNMFEECWCVILDKDGNEFIGYSSGFLLPEYIIAEMKEGKTHIETIRAKAKELQMDRQDTWAIYTKGILSRTASIEEAFRNAFLLLQK